MRLSGHHVSSIIKSITSRFVCIAFALVQIYYIYTDKLTGAYLYYTYFKLEYNNAASLKTTTFETLHFIYELNRV